MDGWGARPSRWRSVFVSCGVILTHDWKGGVPSLAGTIVNCIALFFSAPPPRVSCCTWWAPPRSGSCVCRTSSSSSRSSPSSSSTPSQLHRSVLTGYSYGTYMTLTEYTHTQFCLQHLFSAPQKGQWREKFGIVLLFLRRRPRNPHWMHACRKTLLFFLHPVWTLPIHNSCSPFVCIWVCAFIVQCWWGLRSWYPPQKSGVWHTHPHPMC